MSSNVDEVGAQASELAGMRHRTKSHPGTSVIEFDDSRGLARRAHASRISIGELSE